MLLSSPVLLGALASLAAGMLTFVGGLAVLVIPRPSPAQQNAMLGFAAGIMLAASFFSLIIPALDVTAEAGWDRWTASGIVVGAVLLGSMALAWVNARVPDLEQLDIGPPGADQGRLRRVWLFVAAITIHNFPEGFAVGLGFAEGHSAAGLKTAIGIGLQNIPEGLAVAVALATLGYSRGYALLAALISGLAEPVAGLAGALAVSFATALLPWGLGFAAGAMLYVTARDILPEIQTRAAGRLAMPGVMTGLALMMFLDTTLG